MNEMQKSDPRARRQTISLILLATVLGGALILAAESRPGILASWLQQGHDMAGIRFKTFVMLAAAVILLPVFGFSAYFWRLGSRVVAAGMYPPPGMAVLRDTPVRQGAAALRRGRLLRAGAALLAGAVGAILLLLLKIVSV